MSHFDERSAHRLMLQFWNKKAERILVYSRTEDLAKVNRSEIIDTLQKFAEKFPAGNITIEDREQIFVTVHFSKWANDKVKLHLDTKESTYKLYIDSDAGLDNRVIEVYSQVWRIDLKATLTNIENFVKNYPRYRKQAEKKPDDVTKKAKLDEMARKSVETIVPQMMAKTNCEWSLQKGTSRYTLCVKTKNNKMLKISFTLKNFGEKITQLSSFVTQMHNLIEQSPFIVEIRGCDRFLRWHKSSGNVESVN